MTTPIIYAEIEGLGLVDGGVAYMYRFCTRPPSTPAVAAIYLRGLKLPQAISAELYMLEGRASYGGLELELPSSSAIRELLWTSYRRHTDTIVTDNVATVDTDGLGVYVVNDLIWSSRECMQVSAIGAYPPTIGVFRSRAGTARREELDGYQVFEASNILLGRRVWLYTTDDVETTPELQWAGVLDEITSDMLATVRVSCRSLDATLEGLVGADRWDGERITFRGSFVPSYDGGIGTAFAAMRLAATGAAPAVGTPAGVFEVDGSYYVGTATADHRVVKIWDPELVEAGAEWEPGDDASSAREVLTTWNTAPWSVLNENANIFCRYDTTTASYEDPTTNPVYVALIIMLSTGFRKNADPADEFIYDTLPQQGAWAASLPREMIDLEAWELAATLRDWDVPTVAIGREGADDVLHRLLWPMGIIPVMSAAGTIRPMIPGSTPSTTNPAIVVAESDVIPGSVTYDRQLSRLIGGSGAIKWAGGYKDTILLADTLRWYPANAGVEYEVDATYYDRDTSGAAVRVDVMNRAKRILQPPPGIMLTVRPSLASQISVGTYLSFTHARLGLDNAICLVVAEDQEWERAGGKRLAAWIVDHDLPRVGRIAPTFKVAWYDPATAYVYLYDDPTFDDTDDTLRWLANDGLLLCRASGEPRSINQVDIDTIHSSTVIQIDVPFQDGGGPIEPRPGDLIVPDDYDNVGTSEHDRHLWLADAASTLGAAGDEAYYYTMRGL